MPMHNITLLGLGAMGSRMAQTLLQKGYRITVWNRTPQAAADLVQAGAQLAANPRAAARYADAVIAMLRDDLASREVWMDADTGALAGMRADALAIESSTLTPDWVRELGRAAQARGVAFVEAPVSGSRLQAETGQLVHLVGAEPAALERARPLLSQLGSALHHLGPWGSGAVVKLATNALLGIQVTALAELIGLLRHTGTPLEPALKAMASTSVWSPVANYLAGSMVSGQFQPQFPVELIAKDFGYALALAESPQDLPTTAAALHVFQRGLEAGLGAQNMSAVAQLYPS